ncbi:MAG: GNAT family N-acetyltransferase [Thiothrix sp.]|nr:MAG: GNAT family N-acetyltransferase [Thiothrix sp.]
MEMTTMNMKIEPLDADLELEGLLDLCQLPSDDIYNPALQFFGVKRAGKLVAVIGVEAYDTIALLRSLAVLPDYRSLGLARKLVRFIENQALQQGVHELYLLTTTASNFFRVQGYQLVERIQTPACIQQSAQLSRLCPASALVLMKQLVTQSDVRSAE